ncbi:holin [Caudoviricetes sp.]|nr:holin [Caudoviricetes sp.]
MKSIFKSWTFWTNVLFGAGLVLQVLTQHFVVDLQTQSGLLALANVLLRFKTDKPVYVVQP